MSADKDKANQRIVEFLNKINSGGVFLPSNPFKSWMVNDLGREQYHNDDPTVNRALELKLLKRERVGGFWFNRHTFLTLTQRGINFLEKHKCQT